jgi:hypothetical protein
MYNVVPDLLKVYYVSISVALAVGLVLGFGICQLWLASRKGSRQVDEIMTTSGAAYDAMEDIEPETDHDALAWDILYQAKR